jgi:hypothetical protein
MRRNSNQNLPFARCGLRQGPVTSATIKGLSDKKEIDSDAEVWRKGMSEWKSPPEGDFAELAAARSLAQRQSRLFRLTWHFRADISPEAKR